MKNTPIAKGSRELPVSTSNQELETQQENHPLFEISQIESEHEILATKRFYLESLTSTGYQPETAIFELISNSLDAEAKKIIVTVNKNKKIICVEDDGVGMTSETLTRSMSLGVSRDYETSDTGFFGVGMKSSILNLMQKQGTVDELEGKNWAEIESLKEGFEFSNSVVYRPWVNPKTFTLKINKVSSVVSKSGTKITIHNTKVLSPTALINQIAVYYHKVLRKDVEIFVNQITDKNVKSTKVLPNDPLYRDRPEVSVHRETAEVKHNGSSYFIDIDYVFLPDSLGEKHAWDNGVEKSGGFNMRKSGFYVMYGHQYIETGTNFKLIAAHNSGNNLRAEFTIPKQLTDVFEVKFNKTSGNTDFSRKDEHPKLGEFIKKCEHVLRWGRQQYLQKSKPVPESDKESLDKLSKKFNKQAKDAGIKVPKVERGPRGPYDKSKRDENVDQNSKSATILPEKFRWSMEDFNNRIEFWRIFIESGKVVIIFNLSHPFFEQSWSKMSEDTKLYFFEFLGSLAEAQINRNDEEYKNPDYFWQNFWNDFGKTLQQIILVR